MSKDQTSSRSEWQTARRAHAEHYAAFASASAKIIGGRCPGQSQLRALARLTPEIGNILLALDTAFALGLHSAQHLISALHLHYTFRGEFGALFREFEPLLQRARRQADPDAELACLLALAQAAHRTGRTREFQVLAEAALAMALRADPDPRAVDALNLIGSYWLLQHDFGQARQYLERMHTVARQIGDQVGLASACAAIGALEKYEGNYAQARVMLDSALELNSSTENLHARAFVLNDRASLEYLQGHYAEARTLFLEALALMQECGSRFGSAHVLAYLGNVEAAEGHYQEAQAIYERALEIQLEHGHLYEAGALLLNLGNTALHLGEIELSISRSEAALELLRDAVEPHAVATCLQNLGQAYSRRGDFARAARTMREALEEHIKLDDAESVILNCLAAAEGLQLAGLADAAQAIAGAVAVQVEQRAMVLEVDERDLLGRLLLDAHDLLGNDTMSVTELGINTLDALESMAQDKVRA